jgi:aconitate hydratase
MREAVGDLGGDPTKINPLAPAELVIDHSVIADLFGTENAFERNVEIEYQRNGERYQFLRWGQTAFDDFKVVPPGTGIVHQVNIEYLARVTYTREVGGVVQAYPDTLVGTDSHTTMVNGLGVLGWGVGGIEAEAAMLGQPVSMLIPKVVGFKLSGAIPAGVTATDVVLTITQMLRKHGVVGKFVEFYGDGVAQVPLANRATIGNMSPEFGSTAAIFPVDDVTLDYLRLTGRSDDQVALVEAYSKEQKLWHDPSAEPVFSEYLELDLATVVPSIAGPRRPQDRIELSVSKEQFNTDLNDYAQIDHDLVDLTISESFPASDPGELSPEDAHSTHEHHHKSHAPSTASKPTPVELAGGEKFTLDHGAVAIAAITSCTNTSNPSVMLAAGLLARNAAKKGLKAKPWVKTTLAPGSKVVTDYYEKAGLTGYLEDLGFYLVGYGCTTCIGNSGPLIDEISTAVQDNDLAVTAVLSGNRNFEGRINPDVKMNYLASPPLVIAYALAGSMNFDFDTDALGTDADGNDVFLKDIWPDAGEVQSTIDSSIDTGMFTEEYAGVFDGDERWQSLPTPTGATFEWDEKSTYVRKPPYFDGMTLETTPVANIAGARVLAKLGDSVTTDHISPAGSIKADSPAGRYLTEHGVERKDFNSYGSRRGNHEVMIRGTFANIRLRNQLLADANNGAGVEGGYTRDFTEPDAPQSFIFDASEKYQAAGIPLVIFAGKEYGSGSSRDWAAKGTTLLGVRAVIAESFERIHRSNLIGMGVIPLQFPDGESANSLGLDGTESVSITGIDALNNGSTPKTVHVLAEPTEHSPAGKQPVEFDAVVRIDTPGEADYYRNGGILQYVLRSLVA